MLFASLPRSTRPLPLALTIVILGALLTGCDGPQSALVAGGREAGRIAALFWWMAAGAVVVWIAVIALAIWCVRARPPLTRRRSSILIIGGGVVVPTLVLTALLVYGLAMIPPLVARAPEGSLQIEVIGEQWWWRVRYLPPGGEPVDLANEIRLPVGEPVQFRLMSDNVIHSFWIPSLGGKMDMIPGRVTSLTLHPTRTGVFRGACAEYCGASHALMSFYVEVLPRADFDRWLERQAAPAVDALAPPVARGQALFSASGCGACHTVRGTPAAGAIGPDLTHVGSRLSLGAGILPNDFAAVRRWLARTEQIKPGVHMPHFGMLAGDEVDALAAYLQALR